MKTPSILILAEGPDQFNGPNVWLLRMAPKWQKAGFDVSVLFLKIPDRKDSVHQLLLRKGVKSHLLNVRNTYEETCQDLLRWIADTEFDAAVINHLSSGHMIAPELQAAGIPVISILRSDDAFFGDLIRNFYGSKSAISQAVCVSPDLQKQVCQTGFPEKNTLYCPSGTPVPRMPASFPEFDFQLIYTGRIVEKQKRILSVSKAMMLCFRKCQSIKGKLIGTGPDLKTVQDYVQESESGEHVHLAGSMTSKEIFRELQNSGAFLLLSEYEGTSTSLLEAMACGVPPIVTQAASGGGIVRDNINGFIVEPNPESVWNVVEKLKNDRALWERVSVEARKTVAENFSSSAAAKKWTGLLRQACSDQKAKAKPQVATLSELSRRTSGLRINNGGLAREILPRTPVELLDSISMKGLPEKERIFLDPPFRTRNIDLYVCRTEIRNALLRAMPAMSGQFLDIGCGVMPYRELIEKGSAISEYAGMDIQTELYQAELDLVWDGQTMPVDDASIDSAMATEVLEHCPDPQRVLDESFRVLKPGGFLFLTVPFLWPLHNVPWDEYRYTPYSMRRMLENAGYENIWIQPLGGWDAALVQMFGLWVNRRRMPLALSRPLALASLPFLRMLYRMDRSNSNFSDNQMLTGLCVHAWK